MLAIGGPAPKPTVKLSAWIVFDDEGTSVASFKNHAKLLSSVSAEWIVCSKTGAISRPSKPTEAQRAQLLDIAKKNQVKLYALVANSGFTPEGVEAAMATPEAMKTHIDAMVSIAVQDGVDGIDLDYESLMAKDREAFSVFVQKLADALHAKKLGLVMAVHAKESEPGNWDGAQAQDFAVIGKAADFVRVMTYDFHWETSEAGPIAPPDWVDRVMTFAKSEIPASKPGDLELPAYGYSWPGKKASDFGWDGLERASQTAAWPTVRDPASLETSLDLRQSEFAYFSRCGEASRLKDRHGAKSRA